MIQEYTHVHLLEYKSANFKVFKDFINLRYMDKSLGRFRKKLQETDFGPKQTLIIQLYTFLWFGAYSETRAKRMLENDT